MEHETYESWDQADNIRDVINSLPNPLLNERLDTEEVLGDLWELGLLTDEEEIDGND